MIVVDTDVLSETMRRTPDARVLAWLEAFGNEVAITSITIGELLYGVQRLPDGDRRHRLTTAVERLVENSGERLLGFDEAAAREYASLRVARERAGKPVSAEDLMIGGICRAHRLPVATRNVAHFEGFGLEVVNPWDYSG